MSTSSISSDAPLVQLLSNTARWVSKLKREPEEVARVLHAIGHMHPDALAALESHFQSFCIMQGRDLPTIQRLWTATPLSDDDDDPLDVLRAMYWADNPEDCLLETRSYDDVKRQIEMDWGYWKCAHPVGYVRVEPKTGEICILSQNKMRDLLLDVHYAQPSQTSRVENVPIGPRWLADENKRRYTRIVVDPTMRHDPAEFNMWVGFAAEKLPPVAVDEVPALVQPLLDHIRDVLATGNVDHCRYIVDWMSFLVQKPERRTQTLLLFHGQQGTGKGIIWDFVRDHVLGPHACTQTANAKNDLFDRFSNGFLHKRLVQLDEVCLASRFLLPFYFALFLSCFLLPFYFAFLFVLLPVYFALFFVLLLYCCAFLFVLLLFCCAFLFALLPFYFALFFVLLPFYFALFFVLLLFCCAFLFTLLPFSFAFLFALLPFSFAFLCVLLLFCCALFFFLLLFFGFRSIFGLTH